jgi:hypothetical protein
MVEYLIYPNKALEWMQDSLPSHYEPGYTILIDKDKNTKQLPKASSRFRSPELPTLDAFKKNLKEFWFNAYLEAKYIWRSDLWRVKHYDWQLKGNLLDMMGWHALVISGNQSFTTHEGRDIKQWIDSETFTSLMTVFGRFYPADSWRALEDTIKIFTRLAVDVAKQLKVDPRMDLYEKFMPLIKDLQTHPPE